MVVTVDGLHWQQIKTRDEKMTSNWLYIGKGLKCH